MKLVATYDVRITLRQPDEKTPTPPAPTNEQIETLIKNDPYLRVTFDVSVESTRTDK